MITRSKMTDISAIIDKKFEEFKTSLLVDLKTEIDKVLQSGKDELSAILECKKNELNKIYEQHEINVSIAEIKKHVHDLKENNNRLREQNRVLKSELDDLQQYVGRPNLRIYGVPVSDDEPSSVVEAKVQDIIAGVLTEEAPKISIDRAHRISKKKKNERGFDTQPIIVRFPTFRERTQVYKLRKAIKDKFGYGVSLDLTASRLDLLNKARETVKNYESIEFVYSDINCYLRVFTKQKKHIIFNSELDLMNVVANL